MASQNQGKVSIILAIIMSISNCVNSIALDLDKPILSKVSDETFGEHLIFIGQCTTKFNISLTLS